MLFLSGEVDSGCKLRDLVFDGEPGDCFDAEGCGDEEEATASATGLLELESEAGFGCCRRLKRDDMIVATRWSRYAGSTVIIRSGVSVCGPKLARIKCGRI